MSRGEAGPAVAQAMSSQMIVGEFFGAESFVEVAHAHVAVDYEVMGDAGLSYLRTLVSEGASLAVPTTRNSRAVCPRLAAPLGQAGGLVEREAEVGKLLSTLGVELTNTCVPYEGAYVPTFGERLAWGDTGAVAFVNSAIGARSNFEGGVAGLWAALTGRTPAFALHLDNARRATTVCSVSGEFEGVTDWAVLGALIGERLPGYASVPFIEVDSSPSDDALKGLAASLASYGSIGMFHVAGRTPEAVLGAAGADISPVHIERFDRNDVRRFYERSIERDMPSLVVFTAPQLSVQELTTLAELVGDRRFHHDVTVIVTTSPRSRDLLANTTVARLEHAGAMVVEGTCWYLMDPARMRSQFGWRRVLTNSPKLANIIPASGYLPIVRPFEVCVEAAVTGRLPKSTC